eukprot:COSAG02_NODE_2852_length_7896_cov_2.541490_2_plen_57_part_00
MFLVSYALRAYVEPLSNGRNGCESGTHANEGHAKKMMSSKPQPCNFFDSTAQLSIC